MMKTIKRLFYRLIMLSAIAGIIISAAELLDAAKPLAAKPENGPVFSRQLDLSRHNCSYVKASKFISDYSEYQCKPSYGYSVLRYMSDSRDSIIISTPEKKAHDLLLSKTVTMGGYTELGKRAEWRMVRDRGKIKPLALIVPVAINGFHGKARLTHKHWFLGIAKVTKSEICITDVIASETGTLGKNEIRIARQIADRSHGKKCK